MGDSSMGIGEKPPVAGRLVQPAPALARQIGLMNVMVASLMIVTCNLMPLGMIVVSPTISRIGQRLGKPFRDRLADGMQKAIDELARKEAKETDPAKKSLLVQRRQILQAQVPSMQVSPTMGFDAMADSRARVVTLLDSTFSLFLNLGMMVAGIGLLGLRSWGRRAGIVVAISKLAYLLVYALVQVVWMVPLQMGKMEPQLAMQRANLGPVGMGWMGSPAFMASTMYASVLLTVVLASIYSLLVLVCLLKPSVRVACSVEPPSPGEPSAP